MMRRFALLAAAAPLALAACASIERPPAPASVTLPDRFALLDAETAAAVEPTALLPNDDPAFVALRDQAVAGSPDLAGALARIDAARAGLSGAGAARLPDISASAGVERQRISAAQFGGGGGNAPFPIQANRTQFDTAISASWDLDLFGRLRASERAARARLGAAGGEAAAVRVALVGDLARAVTDYRALSARRQLADEDRVRAETLAGLTRARADAGLAPGLDVVRAEALAEQAKARLQPLAAERAAVLARIATLAAVPVDSVVATLDGAPSALAAGADATLPTLAVPSVLLRRRPDVIAAEQRLAAADAEIAAAAADRFPRLSITGAIGLIALSLGDLFSEDALIGSLGAGVAGPLLDFGRVAARIDQREAEAREAFAAYRGAVFTALGEVEAALGALTARAEEVRLIEAQNRADAQALALATERYENGLESFLAVLDAQRSANASGDALVAARAELQRQRIALYRAIGGDSVAISEAE